ncbi:hypothetical protein Bbelb_366190 [Branchiostoma belcheri]|nr:hypothetical protein Bbelb_366190 [Branchiostoma belcheri]
MSDTGKLQQNHIFQQSKSTSVPSSCPPPDQGHTRVPRPDPITEALPSLIQQLEYIPLGSSPDVSAASCDHASTAGCTIRLAWLQPAKLPNSRIAAEGVLCPEPCLKRHVRVRERRGQLQPDPEPMSKWKGDFHADTGALGGITTPANGALASPRAQGAGEESGRRQSPT